jgi:hypothetical protein
VTVAADGWRVRSAESRAEPLHEMASDSSVPAGSDEAWASIHSTNPVQSGPALRTILSWGGALVVVGALWGIEEHAASITTMGARATRHHRLDMV